MRERPRSNNNLKRGLDEKEQAAIKKISPERLEKARREVDTITDGLNKLIDEDIREGVATFRALGIETTQSCEGHLDRGSPSPYIDVEAIGKPEHRFEGEREEMNRVAKAHDISPDEIMAWPQDEERLKRAEAAYAEMEKWRGGTESKISAEYEAWEKLNERMETNINKLLAEFYVTHEKPENSVVLDRGRLRISTPLYDKYMEHALDGSQLPDTDRGPLSEALPRYQAEMNAFIEFLKKEFFEK